MKYVELSIKSSAVKNRLSLNLCARWKLFLILLEGLGDFSEIITCRNEDNEYKGLSIEEMMILNGQLGLCTFGSA